MEKPPSPGPQASIFQADTTTFKELVQRLTGPHDESAAHAIQSSTVLPTPSPKLTRARRPTFKLNDRRQGSRSKLTIMRPNSSLMGTLSSGPSEISSPSSAGISPSNDLSGLRLCDKESPSAAGWSLGLDEEAEEKAIKERRFYLHPSPRGSRPRNAEPELLPLFPLTSPKSFQP